MPLRVTSSRPRWSASRFGSCVTVGFVVASAISLVSFAAMIVVVASMELPTASDLRENWRATTLGIASQRPAGSATTPSVHEFAYQALGGAWIESAVRLGQLALGVTSGCGFLLGWRHGRRVQADQGPLFLWRVPLSIAGVLLLIVLYFVALVVSLVPMGAVGSGLWSQAARGLSEPLSGDLLDVLDPQSPRYNAHPVRGEAVWALLSTLLVSLPTLLLVAFRVGRVTAAVAPT